MCPGSISSSAWRIRTRGVAVISLHRLTPEFYGEAEDPRLLLERAVKEAIHETGHMLGLTHCQRPGCIMRFSNAIADTDNKGPGLCEDCRGVAARMI